LSKNADTIDQTMLSQGTGALETEDADVSSDSTMEEKEHLQMCEELEHEHEDKL